MEIYICRKTRITCRCVSVFTQRVVLVLLLLLTANNEPKVAKQTELVISLHGVRPVFSLFRQIFKSKSVSIVDCIQGRILGSKSSRR
jgi:hypothetical protein